MGGVQFHKIEKLQLDMPYHFPDRFYRDLLRRCPGVRKLKMGFEQGVGMLVAVMRDDLMPMLEEVHLECTQEHESTLGEQLMGFLARWVEVRQGRAAQGSTEDHIHRIKKLVVLLLYADILPLSEDTKKRIEDAVGDDGQFVWRLSRNQYDLQDKWKAALETDGHGVFNVNKSGIASANVMEGHYTDSGKDAGAKMVDEDCMAPRLGHYDPLDDE
jgi:hypothetical protein